ncbi:MAG: DUF721 domain-containing protein [Alphaproteobacteria bacterium]|nr:DUF721 domain-containing protein [Alphaproteobacteria bacterium]
MTSEPPRKSKRPHSLAELTRDAINPAAAKLGFGESDILLHWQDIAGERLAAVCEPLRLQWPTRAPNRPPDTLPEPATLVLQVEGAFALEAQHLAPLLIERVNARLGWKCVGRISLRQGPVRRRAQGRGKPLPPGADAVAAAQAATQNIADEDLRAALVRLGARALGGKPGTS